MPIGGRSSLEFGTELRYRITPTIGLVPFFDAGNVYPTNLPNRASLFYGAGLGLRYYTAIGPIRLDLAFPIDKRGERQRGSGLHQHRAGVLIAGCEAW